VKARASTTFGLVAAVAAIAFSIPVAVTAYGDPAPEPTTTTTTTTAAPPPDPEGPGCGGYTQQVPTGKGSVAGMATESVTDAVANNPMLTTLTAAISGQLNPKVNLVDTLNTGDHILFAPVDDAFAKLSPEEVNALKTDPAALGNLLNYHVILGMLGPGDVHGRLTTLQGKQVTVKGSGGDITVDGVAKVICGGIHTRNGVIYMIDTVLDPAGSVEATTTATTSETAPTSTTVTSSPAAATTPTTTQR
jgi:uncharacterized surface protein with fasciclin (FAS1) repeats